MHKHKSWVIAHIASLYYVDNLTQEMIAEQMQVSRSTISRALLDARKNGIVEIHINYPFQQVEKLETAICKKFGLQAARVLKASKEWTYGDVLEGLGILAAQYFQTIVRPNSLVVISSGNSVYHTVKALEEQKLDLDVIQVMGVPSSINPVIDGPELAQLLVQRLGGFATYVQAPFVVKNTEIYQKLMEEEPFEAIINRVKQANCALVGVGTVDPLSSSLSRTGFTVESLEELMRCGAVGEISGQTFDRFGQMVTAEKAQKAVSIELKYLKDIPCVIGIAGGLAKVEAIGGALAGKLLDVLVTDQDVAEAILDMNP